MKTKQSKRHLRPSTDLYFLQKLPVNTGVKPKRNVIFSTIMHSSVFKVLILAPVRESLHLYIYAKSKNVKIQKQSTHTVES